MRIDTSNITEKRLGEIQDYVDKMPSLPTTVTKVLEVCNQPNPAPNDLNKVISLDPVLTGQVLKLINSAYYSMPNKITSLTRAIIMLGLNTVKNLALSTAVLGTMKNSVSVQGLAMEDFWFHSISVGVTSKAIAGMIKIPPSAQEEFFLGGLLHDLGKIPLGSCYPQEYEQALQLADLEQGPLFRSEQMVMGLNHAQVGKLIAQKWKLNHNIIQLLGSHHTPEEDKSSAKLLIQIVALADIYINIYEMGVAGNNHPQPALLAYLLKQTRIKWHWLASLRKKVNQEIEKAQIFLKI
jgi:HD-like signal output (HDOD) protein